MGGDDADELFDWLADMPFVQSRPGYWEYHPKVRKLMLRFARSRSVKDSNAVHHKLQAYHRSLLAEETQEARYRDETWRRRTLEALYHGLMQNSPEAVREGLETFLLALRGYYSLAGEIAILWLQAADEQEATNEVTRWAQLLGVAWTAIESQSLKAALPFYEVVREREDLSGAARSEAYFIGGLAYYDLQDYERAIEEYGRAIELNPEYATAYYNRACAYALLGEAEDACEWLEKAIELDEKYREMAQGDKDFNGIRQDGRFKVLVGENG